MTAAGAEADGQWGVDADDGAIDGQAFGNALSSTNVPVTNGFTLNFIPTTDGKLPQWFGFVGVSDPNTAASIQILGVGGSLIESIQLSALQAAINQNPYRVKFQGFIVGQEISAVRFVNGIAIDHFQYGYGAAPIPEPASLGLLAGGVFLGLRRRR